MNPSVKKTTPFDAELGFLIKQRRLGLRISGEKVSKKIGITRPQLCKYEGGIDRLTVKRLQDIGKALGVNAIYFLEQMEEQC